MMACLRFTTAAYRDLSQIMQYLRARHPGAATRVLDRINKACRGLARNPGVGPLRADLMPNLRFFPVGNYLIFYRENDQEGQIIRILHGARDYGPTDF